MKRTCALLLGLLLGSSAAHAASKRAEPTLRFDHLGASQGLPSSSVYTMVQDATGFMWFSVGGGLARYDGHRFEFYEADPEDPHAVSNAFLSALHIDRQGTLWVGASDGTLHRYDAEKDRFDRFRWDPATDPEPLDEPLLAGNKPPYRITFIHDDAAGRLWVGTLGGGLRVFDRATEEFTEQYTKDNSPLPTNFPLNVYEGDSGALWIGSWQGVVRFDPDSGDVLHLKRDPGDPNSLNNEHVTGIVPGRDGRLWIATIGGGLHEYDTVSETLTHFDGPSDVLWVNDIHQDRSGLIWLATETSGLVRYDPRDGRFTRYSLPDGQYSARRLYEDGDGVLWVASWIGGVYRVPLKVARFEYYRHDPDNDNSPTGGFVTDIYEAPDGILWLANADGLDRFDREAGRFKRFKPDANLEKSPRNYLRAIARGPGGNLWICSINTGLKRFDPATETFTHFQHDPDEPYSIATDSCDGLVWLNGKLWLTTKHGGLDSFDPTTGRFTHYKHDPDDETSLGSDKTSAILVDSSGMLWVGTREGLDRFDPATGKATHFAHEEGREDCLGPGRVSALYEEGTGSLWVGTNSGALSRLDRNTGDFQTWWPNGEPVKRLSSPQDIDWHMITGIVEADGALWVATGHGLYRMDDESHTFRPLGAGLEDTERSYMSMSKGRGGELYLGGMLGVTIFRPEEYEGATERESRIAITGIEVLDREGNVQARSLSEDPVHLSWDQNVLSIDFAALSYALRGERRYRYKLDGHTDWIVTKSPSVVFGSLGPGEYDFVVHAEADDGSWSGRQASLTILVDPPPWRTWWAYLAYGLLAFAAVVGSVRYREQIREQRQLSRWNRELERRVAEATREVRETEEALIRTSQLARFGEFAASVAHDLKTPLTFIRGELELLEEAHREGHVDAEMLSETIASLLDHCRRMRAEIETAMSYVRPSEAGTANVQVITVLEEVARMLRVRASQSNVTVEVDVEDGVEVAAHPDSLRHVIANLVVNAIEAMPAGGRVTLDARRREDQTEIRVADNGPGVEDQVRGKLFEPFVSTKGEQGTGLGLASCQRLIEEEMGGQIQLERTEPGHTVFLIRLPAGTDPDEVSQQAASADVLDVR